MCSPLSSRHETNVAPREMENQRLVRVTFERTKEGKMKKTADNCSGGDHYFLATSWLDNQNAEDKYLFHLNEQKVVSCVYLFLPANVKPSGGSLRASKYKRDLCASRQPWLN